MYVGKEFAFAEAGSSTADSGPDRNAGRPLAIVAVAFALLVAGMVIVGRLLDVDGLTTLWPGSPALKPGAAVALAASALSLAFAVRAPRLRLTQAGLGLAVAALGCSVLFEQALGLDPGLQAPGLGGPPAPASTAFLALGVSLALLPAKRTWLAVMRGALAGVAIVAAFAGLLAFFAAPAELTAPEPLFRAPPACSLAVLLLGLGVIAVGHRDRLAGEFVSVVAPILGLAAMAALAGVTLVSVADQRRLRDRAEDAETVAAKLDSLLGRLRDAETGLRGYLLTGEEAYLQPWASAAPKVAGDIDRIAALSGESVEARSAVAQIRTLAETKLDELRRTIDLERAGQADAARAIVQSGVGRRLMDRLRQDVTALRDASALNADRLAAAADRARAQLLYAALVSVATVAVLALVLLLDGRRRLAAMRRSQLGLAAANEDLDRFVAERTRDLAVALDSARSELALRRQAEEALRKNEKRLQLLTDATSIAVYSMGPDWKIMRRMTGDGSLGEVEGGDDGWLERFVPAAERDRVLEAIRTAVETKTVFRLEHQVIREDGAVAWVDSTATPLFDEAGEIVEWFGAATNVTARKHAEERLLRSEKRLRLLVEASSSIVYSMNPDWTEMRQLTGGGFETETVDRLWFRRLVPREDRARFVAAIQTAIKARTAFELEHRIVRPDGSVGWMHSCAAPVIGDDGEILEWFGAATDIGERKLAEERLRDSEALLAAVLDQMPIGAGVTDMQGRFILKNARMARFTGDLAASFDPGRFARWRAWDADGNPLPREKFPVATVLAGGPETSVEALFLDPAGGEVWAQAAAAPLRSKDGALIGAIPTVVDIDKRKRAEEALRESERRLQGAAEALALAKAEAERANLAKSKFLAAASHDLRQPVQSLVLLMSLAQRQVAADPRAAHTVAMMQTALGGLNGLMTAILDISRLDAGAIEPAPETVDLGEMAARLATEYAPKAAARGLELRVRTRDFAVTTDPALIERALRNLIENALRYTERGGVLIGLRRRGGRARIDVVDTGPGIPPGKQAEIFEEFRQLHNPGRDLRKGLGLGLAIVARLAPLVGAGVEVSSRSGRGSRFSMTLPLSPSPAPAVAAAETAPPAGPSRGAVLVIEDNEILRASLEAMMSGWGYAVSAAGNGEEALDLSSGGVRFDAIVTDFRLGDGVNGIEAALEIERDAGRPLPKLVLTGDTAPESLAEIKASGFGCLHKPVAAEALRRKLADMLAA